MRLPCLKKPCKDCPFRKTTLKGWLGEARMKEILGQDTFVCHKNNNLQCAGHMLIKDDKNAFVLLARQLGIETGVTGRELVFDNEDDCVKHHFIPGREMATFVGHDG